MSVARPVNRKAGAYAGNQRDQGTYRYPGRIAFAFQFLFASVADANRECSSEMCPSGISFCAGASFAAPDSNDRRAGEQQERRRVRNHPGHASRTISRYRGDFQLRL